MIRSLHTALRRFKTGEDGSMVVPFALWTPVFLGLIVSSIELGTLTIRHTSLERGLDTAVRDLKLGTGPSDHASLKQAICDEAPVLRNCMTNLQLEMIPLDMTSWTAPAQRADCADLSQDVSPLRNFTQGGAHEMMFVRACYKFQPTTPISSFNASLPVGDDGYTALVATAAYVNEPR